jgi:hypothetical protein
MAKTHVFLYVTMDWELGQSELSNLFEDAIIHLPNGQDISDKDDQSIECIKIQMEEGRRR